MSSNYAVDFTLYFDTVEQCEHFTQMYKESDYVRREVDLKTGMEVDELYEHEGKDYCQLVGTADDIPGKRALTYLQAIKGVGRIEVWHDGDSRGELTYIPEEGEIRYEYLPDEHYPEDGDPAKVEDAFDDFAVTEEIKLENMWE